MSSLAKILIDEGHIVKGVDSEEYFFTEKNLQSCKVEKFTHMNLKKYFYYIIGNAYINHSIVKYIKKNKYYYKEYPKFINDYFKKYQMICVCGSHGKTTTSKMLATILPGCNYLIGDASGYGKGKNYFILEACEYKNTFLNYYPQYGLFLNIDYDHPDFFKNENQYIESFEKFSLQCQNIIVNGDDKNTKLLKKEQLTYGINKDNNFSFTYKIVNNYMLITIDNKEFKIPLLGKHYAYDFVGAYIMAKKLGINDEEIQRRILKFKTPKRRLQINNFNNTIFILDYAHHPTEIECLRNTTKLMYGDKKLICFFQPHTLSRSEGLKDKFKKVLDKFDETYLLHTFTSVRENINMIIENEIYKYWGYKLISKENIINYQFNCENVYLFVGAGDIDLVYQEIIK